MRNAGGRRIRVHCAYAQPPHRDAFSGITQTEGRQSFALEQLMRFGRAKSKSAASHKCTCSHLCKRRQRRRHALWRPLSNIANNPTVHPLERMSEQQHEAVEHSARDVCDENTQQPMARSALYMHHCSRTNCQAPPLFQLPSRARAARVSREGELCWAAHR